MLKMCKTLCVVAALVAVCAGGVQWVRSSWQGVVYFYPEGGHAGSAHGQRKLAQVDKRYDFSSHRSGGVLASKKRLVQSLKWHRQDGVLGVELGHFVVKTGQNSKNFACNVYRGVELEFVAEGVAVHGQPSRMWVRGPCRVRADDNSRMQVLWLPVHRAFDQRPQDLAALSINSIERGQLVAAGFQVPELGGQRPGAQRLTASDSQSFSATEANLPEPGAKPQAAKGEQAANKAVGSGRNLLEPDDDDDDTGGFIVGTGQGPSFLQANVSFQNIGDVWPTKWHLSEVKLLKNIDTSHAKQGESSGSAGSYAGDSHATGSYVGGRAGGDAVADAARRDTASVDGGSLSVNFREARRILGRHSNKLELDFRTPP